jgi:phytoene dehydrogenase-like protein
MLLIWSTHSQIRIRLTEEPVMYDAIIIGAGMSGLTCGCYLAKAGLKVLIVEQHSKVGGYCTSFVRGGFTFDAAAHSLGGFKYGNLWTIFNDIGLFKKVTFKKCEPSNTIITPDHKISFWNNIEKTIEECQSVFPAESLNIKIFFHDMLDRNSTLSASIKSLTFQELLNRYFKDQKLMSMLSYPLFGNSGLPPSLLSAFIGIKIFREFLLDGGYSVQNGIQNIPDALADIFREFGGELYLSSRVKTIETKDKSVIGINLEQGDFLPAKYVISNCDSRQTFISLLGTKVVDKYFLKTVRHMMQTLSVFAVYMGFEEFYDILTGRGTNLWMLHRYDLENIYISAQSGKINKIDNYLLHISPERKTMTALMITPFKTRNYWIKSKERIRETFIKTVESDFSPDLSKHIQYKDAATPYTLYRYTSNYRGAAFGWACTPSQIAMINFRKPAFLKGLYMTGHWTTNGLGIPGVVYIGHDTARMILRKEKLAN